MNIKKLTTYAAASLAIVASSSIPAGAAVIQSGAGLLEGDFRVTNPTTGQTTTLDPNQVLLQLFRDPTLIQRPNSIGLSGVTDYDRVDNAGGSGAPTTVQSTIANGTVIQTDTTNPQGVPDTVVSPQGALGSARLNAGGVIQLGARADAALDDGRGSTYNGAISFGTIDTSITVNRPNQTGNVTQRLTLRLNGGVVERGANQGVNGVASAGAGAGVIVNPGTANEQVIQLTPDAAEGNNNLIANITVPVNTAIPIRLGLGSAAVLTGGATVPTSASADFARTLTLTGFDVIDPNTGQNITNQVTATTDTGLNLVQAAQVGAALTPIPEPPATVGLLVLGAGLVGSTQLKKLKSARKKAVKL